MRDPLNVKEISEVCPDFLGFIFYSGSPRYVGEKPDRSLFRNVPSEITGVGVFVNEESDKVVDIAKHAGIEMIQLHGNESPVYCQKLRSSGLKIIKAFSIPKYFEFEVLRSYLACCDYFLFDTKTGNHGGSGRKFNWEILAGYSLDKSFFISGGIGPDDARLIKTFKSKGLFGADINSRFENTSGIKNVSLVKTFIDAIKNDQI